MFLGYNILDIFTIFIILFLYISYRVWSFKFCITHLMPPSFFVCLKVREFYLYYVKIYTTYFIRECKKILKTLQAKQLVPRFTIRLVSKLGYVFCDRPLVEYHFGLLRIKKLFSHSVAILRHVFLFGGVFDLILMGLKSIQFRFEPTFLYI